MRWIIKVTYQDDRAIPIACESIINAEMLDDVPPNFRTSIFEQMVKQIKDKLTEKNTIQLAADAGAFHGLPQASVSASNVDGNDVTDGETSPIKEIDPNKWAFDNGLEST